MAVSSVQFLFVFLPFFLAAYHLLPRALRNGALSVLSLLFCAWGGLRYALLLVVMAAFNWGMGLAQRYAPAGLRKPLLALAVAGDLGVLFWFKYAGFTVENLNALFSLDWAVPALALPLGLSFYTFQGISYCIDAARGDIVPTRNPVKFFVWFAFFAHLASGPIVRWSDQSAALDPGSAARRVDADRFGYGTKRFILGLAKKTLIADQLAVLYLRVSSAPPETLPGSVLLLGYVTYAVQLYYDFSGYSDMAIGLGEMFGLTLPENFRYPYLSRSIGEFWRRWHITLGAWFRDYVYIPLGGSRKRLRHTCRNLLIVFVLTGLWHGAAWQYLAFGLLHAVCICLERLGLKQLLDRLPGMVGRLYTLAMVQTGFVLFGAHGLRAGLETLWGIWTWQEGAPGMTFAAFADPKTLLLLALGLLLCGPVQAIIAPLRRWLYERTTPRTAGLLLLAVLLFAGMVRATASTYTAFIYAQF